MVVGRCGGVGVEGGEGGERRGVKRGEGVHVIYQGT